MPSGFNGGDFFSLNGGRSANMTNTNTNNPFIFHPNTLLNNNNNPQQQHHHQHQPQQQFPFRSPLSGLLHDPASQIRRPDFIGKRSLSEYQQNQQNLAFYLRNVKQRSNSSYQQQPSPISTLSPVDFSPVPSNSSNSNSLSSGGGYGVPILSQNRFANLPTNLPRNVVNNNVFSLPNSMSPHWSNNPNTGPVLPGRVQENQNQNQLETKKTAMDNHLLELEKQLLGDEEDEENGEAVSVVTNANSEWSDTIQTLMKSPTRNNNNTPITPSPTSSTSSCSSTSASPPVCLKQSMIDAATAVCDGKPEVAAEILTRLQQVANSVGTSEQRLACYMVSALKSRVSSTESSNSLAELHGKEHGLSTQMLYEVSPCFKLGLMAANLAILEAASENGYMKIHVVDFDIGQGGQYQHLLHALAVANKGVEIKTSLRITTVSGFSGLGEEKMRAIGDGLRSLAQKVGVCFSFDVKNLNVSELCRERLEVEGDEALVVNFAFKLYKLPDESVTTENLRDELLRRVKGLSPVIMTVVEQEINCNTAPLTTRVKDAWDHYGALFDSLDKTMARDNSDRVKIEEGLGRKLANSVACEGRERVERCEVFGKWRARMGMAGFMAREMSQLVSDSLKSKLNSGTRGNPGFSVNEQSGGICFGWMGRTITVASAWR